MDIGDLAGGAANSRALAISADGSTVVGWSSSANGDSEAFRWRAGSGMEGLGDLPTSRFQSEASACSEDGDVVIGKGLVIANGMAQPQAMRWESATGMIGLGFLPGGTDRSYAIDCSADGGIVVGSGATAAGNETFRWTQNTGLTSIGLLPDASGAATRSNSPLACSSDATVIAGSGAALEEGGPQSLWIWSEAAGFTDVAFAPGEPLKNGAPPLFRGNILVSDDVNSMVAEYLNGSGEGIIRWRKDHGVEELEKGGLTMSAWDLSADGSVVVGTCTDTGGTAHAVAWGPDGKIRWLKELLDQSGTDTGDHVLISANAVSADGRIIAGHTGVDPGSGPIAFNAKLDGIWIWDTRLNDNWSESAWFGYYSNETELLIWHAEHGWQYSQGEDELSVLLYDVALASWLWTSRETYPFLYKFGYLEGWIYYYVGGTPANRWFYVFTEGNQIQESQLRDPSG
jgi:probable HAF family extracellular repeat protein